MIRRTRAITIPMQVLSVWAYVFTMAVVAGLQSQYRACPNYADFSKRVHFPLSRGSQGLPLQRPIPDCRLYRSDIVDTYIEEMLVRFKDKDVARLFENCLPNTLDTTIRWHESTGPETFVITGDIDAMWLRDSTFQLQPYLHFSADPDLRMLINGAVQTQARFIIQSPYCNAFQPPKASLLRPANNNQHDTVHPTYDPDVVFECKYEIDSLSSFLRLSRQYFDATQDTKMFTEQWIKAVQRVLRVVQEQSQPSFNQRTHRWSEPAYTFRRNTDMATETLALGGAGYPVNANTSLVRSAFRPSDDSTILQFFIPGNAMLSVELAHLARLLSIASEKGLQGAGKWADYAKSASSTIRDGIFEHAVFDHPKFGKVFAFEIDGYGGRIFQDDANIPSLMSLPLLGFVDRKNEIYVNTRRMVLSSDGNPYYLAGTSINGIGSPHTPMRNIWPMALLVQLMTSDDHNEIENCLKQVVTSTAGLGLIHESINVSNSTKFH